MHKACFMHQISSALVGLEGSGLRIAQMMWRTLWPKSWRTRWRCGSAVVSVLDQPALRARRYPDHQQPALRRMDRDLRLRTPHRRAARPADPPCHHPRDEWRQLPARPEPHEKTLPQRLTPSNPVGLSGQRALAHASYSGSARAKARPPCPSIRSRSPSRQTLAPPRGRFFHRR